MNYTFFSQATWASMTGAQISSYFFMRDAHFWLSLFTARMHFSWTCEMSTIMPIRFISCTTSTPKGDRPFT